MHIWNDAEFRGHWERVMPHQPLPQSVEGIQHLLARVDTDAVEDSLRASLAALRTTAREAAACEDAGEVWLSPRAGGFVGPRAEDVSAKLPLRLSAGFELYDDEAVDLRQVAKPLRDGSPSALEMFFAVGGYEDAGSGVHLGGGFVLTAYHVVAHFLRQDVREQLVLAETRYEAEPFVANESTEPIHTWNNSWSVAAMPPPGSYHLDFEGMVEPLAVDQPFNDFSLVHAPEWVGKRGIDSIRATGDLRPGERITIVGDATDGATRVELSRFVSMTTDGPLAGTAELDLSHVEPGFSGSPALDVDGNLVGIVFAQVEGGGARMIPTEALVGLLDVARGSHDVPQLRRVGFSTPG